MTEALSPIERSMALARQEMQLIVATGVKSEGIQDIATWKKAYPDPASAQAGLTRFSFFNTTLHAE
jgi:hypothetical protein